MLSYVRGREARPAPPGWNVTKTLSQTVVFWSVFLFLIPAGLFLLEDAVGLSGGRFAGAAGAWAGGALFALGGSLGLTSGAVMAVRGRGTPLPADCPRELVVAGPYRYIRNPMAVAGLTQGVAVGGSFSGRRRSSPTLSSAARSGSCSYGPGRRPTWSGGSARPTGDTGPRWGVGSRTSPGTARRMSW